MSKVNRQVAQEMFKQINKVHPNLSKIIKFVDLKEYDWMMWRSGLCDISVTFEDENTETKVKTVASKKALERNYEPAFSVFSSSLILSCSFFSNW